LIQDWGAGDDGAPSRVDASARPRYLPRLADLEPVEREYRTVERRIKMHPRQRVLVRAALSTHIHLMP
jgi:hypothetical protein